MTETVHKMDVFVINDDDEDDEQPPQKCAAPEILTSAFKSTISMHVEAAKPDDAKTPRSKLKLKKGGRLSRGDAQGR